MRVLQKGGEGNDGDFGIIGDHEITWFDLESGTVVDKLQERPGEYCKWVVHCETEQRDNGPCEMTASIPTFDKNVAMVCLARLSTHIAGEHIDEGQHEAIEQNSRE